MEWQFAGNLGDLLLFKLNYLMDSFWEAIADLDVDIDWLVKVKTHLDETEKRQAKTKPKKSISFSRNSQHKIMVFEQFNEHVSISFSI